MLRAARPEMPGGTPPEARPNAADVTVTVTVVVVVIVVVVVVVVVVFRFWFRIICLSGSVGFLQNWFGRFWNETVSFCSMELCSRTVLYVCRLPFVC